MWIPTWVIPAAITIALLIISFRPVRVNDYGSLFAYNARWWFRGAAIIISAQAWSIWFNLTCWLS